MGVEVALGAMAVAAVAGTGYQVYSGERAASDAQDQRKDAERKARENQKAIEESEANKARAAGFAARKQAARAQGAYGRSGTILTGPSGLGSDSTSGATSTILGG